MMTKQLFKGNGSLGISGSDLFYSAITRGRILNVAGFDGTIKNGWTVEPYALL